ncbi:3'-5' exonuclease, partial [Methanoregula sp.]|uniref:3'-5' exonuclease n=1 Tax=Methanoregula sp. TaxID=2052170 RepID=UPI0025FE2005
QPQIPSPPKVSRMFLFLDTETTGLPKYSATNNPVEKWPRVVQLAWSLYDSDGIPESRNSFIIYPTDFSIPADSARIHGITTERAKAEGVSLFKVLPQFNADVEKAETVVAHNLDFDLPIVTTEFLRCSLETGLLEKQKFCTMKTPQVVTWCKIPKASGYGYKWPTLNELHLQLFQEEFTDSHNAGADVEACARCYFELRKRGIIG